MPILRTLIILMILSCGNVYSQDFIRINNAEFAGQNVEGKKLYKNFKKAEKLFDKGESFFKECLDLLLECDEFNSANAGLNYNIGLCYLKYGKKGLAKQYFEQSKALNPNLNSKLYLYLGQACHYSNDFSKAILNYKMYSELSQKKSEKVNNKTLKIVRRAINACKTGLILSEQTLNFDVEKMPYPINTDANDVLAINEGVKLYFNSDRKLLGDKIKAKHVRGLRGFSVTLTNGEWSNFSILNDEKKSKSLPLLVAKVDENQYLFYDKESGLGDLIFMQKDQKFWTKEMDVFFVNEKKSNESSASFTADGNTVVFVSDRNKGQGDIYTCQKGDDGKWSSPVKLGNQINSEFEEKDVFLSGDGMVIYFSSNGLNSIGGYDIFKSERDENGNWQQAQNMGIPINSAYDECHFFPYEENSFFFDSNRGENGKFDIYSKKLVEDTVTEDEIIDPVQAIEEIETLMPDETVEVLPAVIPMPIPVLKKSTVIPMTYKIQIVASKLGMKSSALKRVYRGRDTVDSSFDGEWYRYTIGNYNTIEDAVYFRDRSGVEDALIVLFENGKRKKIIINYKLYLKK